jgi:hypothetical protein
MKAETRPPLYGEGSKIASRAFTLSIVGIFLFGIILEPIALAQAFKARRLIRESKVPLQGGGSTIAAIIIASISLVGWVLWLVVRAVAIRREVAGY